ncbi:MAG TPA: hypothetical protein VNT50_13040, partial [Microbacterium sp.]|uniref:hypothetical protein n=1 Tax=Microbacterium sp. TaxID=51671 RepID=UPI002C86C547
RHAVSIGALGIETIAEQMMPGFPDLSDEFYATWHAWVEQYGFVPTAHDMFAETKLYRDRDRPTDELVDDLTRDIDHTRKLGAGIIRILATTPPEVVDLAAGYAGENGVRLLTEIHSPLRLESPWFDSHMANAEKWGPGVVGFMPDLGIFVRRFPRIIAERALRDGADPGIVQRAVATYDDGGDVAALLEQVASGTPSPAELRIAMAAGQYTNEDPRALLAFMPYIGHIQAKFYEMVDDRHEFSIPYDEIIAVLKEGGYAGYLSSEYEGNRHIQDAFPVDSREQLRRHHAMMSGLLGEGQDSDV